MIQLDTIFEILVDTLVLFGILCIISFLGILWIKILMRIFPDIAKKMNL